MKKIEETAGPSMPPLTPDQFQESEVEPAWSGLTSKVAIGSIWGIAGQGAILLTSLLATPFTLRLLNTEQYGLLALVNLILNYLALSDLGMQVASTRFATAAHVEHGDTEESRVIWTSFAVTLIPSISIIVILVLTAPMLATRAFQIPPPLRTQAQSAFALMAVIILLRNLAGIANTPQLVRLRFYLFTIITTGGTVVQMVAIPFVLYFISTNLQIVVLTMAICSLCTLVAHLSVSRRLLPALARPQFSRKIAKDLISFGVSLVGMTLLAITLNMERLLLARFSSLTAVAYYSVAYTLASLPLIASTALGQALIPAFSRLHAMALPGILTNLFFRCLRVLALLAIPMIFALCFLGKPLLRIWGGAVYATHASFPLYVLVLGTLLDCFAVVPRILIKSIDKPYVIVPVQLVLLVPYLGLGFLLVLKFGALGAAFAFSSRALVEFVLVYRYAVKKYVSHSWMSTSVFMRWVCALGILLCPFLVEPQALLFRLLAITALGSYVWYGHTFLLEGTERLWIRNQMNQLLGVGRP